MNRRDFFTRVIVWAMVRKGYMDLHAMRRNARNARKKNEALLFRILKKNRDKEYGRQYRFSEIKSLADFRRTVPIIGYHDYEAYIDRMIHRDEKNLLISFPVIAYAQSSGTVGGRRPADPAAGQRIHQAHRHQDDGCAGMKEES